MEQKTSTFDLRPPNRLLGLGSLHPRRVQPATSFQDSRAAIRGGSPVSRLELLAIKTVGATTSSRHCGNHARPVRRRTSHSPTRQGQRSTRVPRRRVWTRAYSLSGSDPGLHSRLRATAKETGSPEQEDDRGERARVVGMTLAQRRSSWALFEKCGALRRFLRLGYCSLVLSVRRLRGASRFGLIASRGSISIL